MKKQHQVGLPAANRTMPPNTIIPVLIYDDLEKATDWLCLTFGFRPRWKAENHRAQLSFDGGTIAISEQQDKSRGAQVQRPAAHSLLCRIADVNTHYAHCLELGAKIIQPPADFPYGERQYSVQDPGGHIWTFSQSIADMAPEDWGGISFEL
jgi:uncharacterized glyoxalase superfamily protein PhnB